MNFIKIITKFKFENMNHTFFRLIFLFFVVIYHPVKLYTQTSNPNGYNKFYYENGKISSEGWMKDGKPNGYWKNYHKNGKIKIEGNRKKFQLDSIWKFYDEKGRITKSINYQEGKKNGLTIVYDTLGKIQSNENFLNDVKNGYSKTFHKNGKVKTITNFVKGKQEGKVFEYSKDSILVAISLYKEGILQGYEKFNQLDENNKKQGLWKEFYDNMELKKEQRFNDDSLDGYVKEFDTKGNLLSTKKYSNGKQILKAPEIANVEVFRDIYEDGTLKYEGVYMDGVAIGTHFKYKKKWQCDSSLFLKHDSAGNSLNVYENRLVCRNQAVPDSALEYFDGTIIAKGKVDSLRNRIGLWSEFHHTGEFKGKGLYKDGNRIGDWDFYYASGKLEQKGKYDKKGREQGIWKWYYENGNIWREENYVNGKREGELKDYDENGKVVLQGNFIDNKKEGKWIYETQDYLEYGNYLNDELDSAWVSFYMPSKMKRFEGTYQAGIAVGIHTLYYSNGKKIYTGNYNSGMKDGDWKFYDEEGLNYLTITYKNDIEIKWQGQKIKPTYEEGLRTYNIRIDKNTTQTIRK